MIRVREIALLSLIVGTLQGDVARAQMVTPSFTTGTVTSRSESTTTVTESINQVDFQTGSSYTVTGTNINIPGSPAPGVSYTQAQAGGAFQFSESFFGPGISRETNIERTTTIETITDSLSVFTQ